MLDDHVRVDDAHRRKRIRLRDQEDRRRQRCLLTAHRSASGIPGPTKLTQASVEPVVEDLDYASSRVLTSMDRQLDETADFFQAGSLGLGR